MKLRPHQKEKSDELLKVLNSFKCAYLAGEVRSGKTITALNTIQEYGSKDVLFITKKKAISSIESDYKRMGFTYKLTVINYESIHKIERNDFDFVVYDEAHSCFIGNTLIDGVNIKDINLGDSIKSFNFTNNKIEHKKVLNKFEKKLEEDLVKIKANEKEIICTESHKIYTKRGWVKAINITDEDYVCFL